MQAATGRKLRALGREHTVGKGQAQGGFVRGVGSFQHLAAANGIQQLG